MIAPTLDSALNALSHDAEMLSSPAATGDAWIPACAGMTSRGAGMTSRGAGMTSRGAGMTSRGTGMTMQGAGMVGRGGEMNHV